MFWYFVLLLLVGVICDSCHTTVELNQSLKLNYCKNLALTILRNTNFHHWACASTLNSSMFLLQSGDWYASHWFKYQTVIHYLFWFWLFMLKLTKYWPLSLNNICIGDILWISGCRDMVIMFTGLLSVVISVKSGSDCIWHPDLWLVEPAAPAPWLVDWGMFVLTAAL